MTVAGETTKTTLNCKPICSWFVLVTLGAACLQLILLIKKRSKVIASKGQKEPCRFLDRALLNDAWRFCAGMHTDRDAHGCAETIRSLPAKDKKKPHPVGEAFLIDAWQ